MSANSPQGKTVANALGFPMGTGIFQSICGTQSTAPLTAQGLEGNPWSWFAQWIPGSVRKPW